MQDHTTTPSIRRACHSVRSTSHGHRPLADCSSHRLAFLSLQKPHDDQAAPYELLNTRPLSGACSRCRILSTARMPYTPPSQLSPAASKPNSPAPNRSQSWLQHQHQTSEGTSSSNRPSLPRSTGSSSYLSKHRRSPSLQKQQENIAAVDFATGANGTANSEAFTTNGNVDPHGSLRQSPPPVNHMLVPTGATLSPPESSHNSSDDEEILAARRGREGRQIENLEELHAAIRIIEQRKESSPNRNGDERRKVQMAGDLMIPQLDGRRQDSHVSSADSSRLPLSSEARKISHPRSTTDSNIVFDNNHQMQSPAQYRQESFSADEGDESDEAPGARRPAMVRKKSGELVRPALRPSSARRRPSSMPGTPTYHKAVHFDSHLEHVRHFLQVDRPLAVSAGSSPVEAYESEAEFPFGSDEGSRPRKQGYEWEIRLANFPTSTDERKTMPIRVERIFLSADNKNLIGAIAVQNLAFQKLVVARFTLDYWKTTSEVVADFNNDVRKKHTDGCDRFSFNIKLADQANLENKTLFFCVKYETNGQQYWDNNNSINYQVDFTKKAKAQPAQNSNPGLGARPLNGLPRSGRSPPATSGSRPRSMPASFDDFASGFDNFGTFVQASPSTLMGESPIKLKSPKPRHDAVSEAPVRRTKPQAQAFGNRYDFGASLSAAIQNASAILGEQSGLPARPDTKQSSREVPAVAAKGAVTSARSLENVVKSPSPGQVSSALAAGTVTSKPAALVSEKPSLQSQSYQELVDKYCFVGTQKKGEDVKAL